MNAAGISVVLPAYDEAAHLRANVARLLAVLRPCGRPLEVVVVNDGSRDDTGAIADAVAAANEDVVARHHARNEGKGQALRTGTHAATQPLVVLLDADLQIPPEDVIPLVERMEAAQADLAVGSKYLPGASSNWPGPRRVLSRLYQICTAVLFRLPLRDTQTGLKVVRREVADALIPRLHAKRFAWDLELVLLAVRAGHPVVTGPVTVNPTERASHVRWTGALQAGVDTLRIFWRYRALGAYGSGRAAAARPTRITVTGDDLGMSPNVDEGLTRGLEVGGLTSVSALAQFPRCRTAADAVRSRAPRAAVGLHLDLLQDVSLSRFLWRDVTGRVPAAQVQRRVRDQISVLRAMGREPTHMDAHRHAYLMPWTRRRVLAEAARQGVPAVRSLVPLDVWGSPDRMEQLKRLFILACSTTSRGLARQMGFVEPRGFVDAQTAASWVHAGAFPHWARGAHIEVLAHPVSGSDDAPSHEQGTLDRTADFDRVCHPPLAQSLAAMGAHVAPLHEEHSWISPPSSPASSN